MSPSTAQQLVGNKPKQIAIDVSHQEPLAGHTLLEVRREAARACIWVPQLAMRLTCHDVSW